MEGHRRNRVLNTDDNVILPTICIWTAAAHVFISTLDTPYLELDLVTQDEKQPAGQHSG